ncbi:MULTISPECIES: PKD-like family lipoprotein [Sphingobacterium]|uniref:PKD-like family lipoprotein n=1 Tax=Sphingobacterium TaxID=28453 RepID=UPI0013DC092B|nr:MULTISPECIES: PKD-like family lipoprotein [unclassified Sphingobacterium]
MKKIVIIVFAFISLCVLGCIKDNSVLKDYEIGDVVITGLENGYTIGVGDRLNINPELQLSSLKESDLKFIWYVYTTRSTYIADTISYERNLSTNIALIPGEYTLVLKVQDNATKVFFRKEAGLVVTDDFTPGFLILSEKNKNASLQFYNTNNNKFIEDIYEIANNEQQIGKNPIDIAFYPRKSSMPSEILILCKDQQGGVVLDPLTMQRARFLKESFLVPWSGTGEMSMQAYIPRSTLGLQDYLIIDGRAYNRAANSGETLFKPDMIGDYYLSPYYFYHTSGRAAFYDNKNKRFMCHNTTSGSLNLFLKDAATLNIIDPTNVGLKMLYGGHVNAGNFFGLFEDDNSKKYILRYLISAQSQIFRATEKYAINAPGINEATVFTSGSGLPNYLFYSVQSKIYAYNILTKVGGELFSLGSDKRVDKLMMEGTQLLVGYSSVNSGANTGSFALYNFSTTGGLAVSEVFKKENFSDKVVDFSYKF